MVLSYILFYIMVGLCINKIYQMTIKVIIIFMLLLCYYYYNYNYNYNYNNYYY